MMGHVAWSIRSGVIYCVCAMFMAVPSRHVFYESNSVFCFYGRFGSRVINCESGFIGVGPSVIVCQIQSESIANHYQYQRKFAQIHRPEKASVSLLTGAATGRSGDLSAESRPQIGSGQIVSADPTTAKVTSFTSWAFRRGELSRMPARVLREEGLWCKLQQLRRRG